MHESYHGTQATAAGTGALGGIVWIVRALQLHGPSWEVVPALVLAAASLVTAAISWSRWRAENRRADDLHRIELERRRRALPPLTFRPEVLPPRP